MSEDLKTLIAAFAEAHPGEDMAPTAVPGLSVMRLAAPSAPLPMVYKPVVCLVAQGAKRVMTGSAVYEFSAGQSLIVGLEMPATGRVIEATPEAPYLAAAVELDAAILREVIAAMAEAPPPEAPVRGVFVDSRDDALAACVLRLLRLAAEPHAIPVLHPLLLRELHYRLLSGRHGVALRQIALPGARAERIARAIRSLQADFDRPLRVETLAEAAGMSLSTFHHHFKTATGLSPLQYQKQLRLLEARRLLIAEAATAEHAAYAVGYESPTQFSREYTRMFGAPPRRDAALLRTA